MKYLEENEQFQFESGRIIEANGGFIGISPDLILAEGYDGLFTQSGIELTKEEKIELADFMISQWQKLKES